MSTSSLAQAIDAILSEPAREILREALPDGQGFKVIHLEADGSYSLHHIAADGMGTLVHTTPFRDLAEHTFAAYDGPRAWHAAYLPRGDNSRMPEKTVCVFAAGVDPEACIVAFLDSLGHTLLPGSLTPMPQEVGETDYQWGYRFIDAETRTGFKAAGRLVPGGAVLTWWR